MRKGLEQININNVSELKSINPKKQGIIVSGKIGQKRRLEILKKAIEMKLTIFNITDPANFVKDKEKQLADKKKKQEDQDKKSKSKEKAKDEAKTSIEDTLTDEEKKKVEKKEIDKLLTKKQ